MIKVHIYCDLGYGLSKYMEDRGWFLYQDQDGNHICEGYGQDPQMLIDSYNPWPIEKAIKFAEIDEAFQSKIDSLTAGWPEGEIKTWTKQETEAILLQSNPNAVTPTLSIIAATRGISVTELASRVLRDAALFTQATAYYVGLRHKARQKVQALPDTGEYHRLSELYNIHFEG